VVSVFVVRAFVKLREFAGAHKELAAKLEQLERKVFRPRRFDPATCVGNSATYGAAAM
jgi:hypothetical protein